MPAKPHPTVEPTYPLRSVVRLTGVSHEVLRAWERRHGAISPLRTPGGTRRYRASDLERLQLLKAAVEAGHRIGRIAGLGNAELGRLVREPVSLPRERLDEILDAVGVLDAAEAQRLLSLQLSSLGAVRFARELATPLAREIGERWAGERMSVASEHLASAILRSLLGAALQPGAAALRGVRIVFATLGGERHELGLLIAGLVALGAGANPIYLGAEVPVEELLGAVVRSGATALALSVIAEPTGDVARSIAALRGGLPANVSLWIGGSGARALETSSGVDRIETLDQLESRVALLGAGTAEAR